MSEEGREQYCDLADRGGLCLVQSDTEERRCRSLQQGTQRSVEQLGTFSLGNNFGRGLIVDGLWSCRGASYRREAGDEGSGPPGQAEAAVTMLQMATIHKEGKVWSGKLEW